MRSQEAELFLVKIDLSLGENCNALHYLLIDLRQWTSTCVDLWHSSHHPRVRMAEWRWHHVHLLLVLAPLTQMGSTWWHGPDGKGYVKGYGLVGSFDDGRDGGWSDG